MKLRRAIAAPADQGHPAARLHLGGMSAKGDGVPQDDVRAHMWFSRSAAQGEQRAVELLEMAEPKRRSSHATGSRLRSHLLVSGTAIAVRMTAMGHSRV